MGNEEVKMPDEIRNLVKRGLPAYGLTTDQETLLMGVFDDVYSSGHLHGFAAGYSEGSKFRPRPRPKDHGANENV